jgi:hypothetical protein
MRTLAGVAMVGVALLAGCPDRSLALVEPQQGTVEYKDIPVTFNRDVDILFLIDNSPSMADKQANLQANFHRFIETLDTIEGGLPNVHIAVATSDLGTKGADDAVPGGFTIQGDGSQCQGYGDDGHFKTNGAPVQGSFLIDTLNSDGTRTRNYTGDLVDVFTQMASVGQSGCGFEQHLEAVHRALDNNPANAGFLRFNAYLAVIILGDEDDCSIAHSTMLGPDTNTFGPLASFRCTRFGVTCAVGGGAPDQMDQVGAKSQCVSNESHQYLTDVQRYVDFLRGLKPDPTHVIVADIGAPPAPVATQIDMASGNPMLAHSCTYTDSSNVLEVGDPTVRIDQFLKGFPDRNTFQDICAQDLSGGLVQVGEIVKTAIGDPCIAGALADVNPLEDGLQYDCQVSDVFMKDTPQEVDTPLQACNNPDDPAGSSNLPCWHIVADTQHCAAGDHLALEVERAIQPPSGTHVVAYCVTQQ